MTTTTSQPAWIDTITGLLDDLRRLDLKIDNDTRLEPAPTDDRDQINTAVLSRTRITSQGRLVAEFEYSGRIRLWHQWQPDPAAPGEAAAAPGDLVLRPGAIT